MRKITCQPQDMVDRPLCPHRQLVRKQDRTYNKYLAVVQISRILEVEVLGNNRTTPLDPNGSASLSDNSAAILILIQTNLLKLNLLESKLEDR